MLSKVDVLQQKSPERGVRSKQNALHRIVGSTDAILNRSELKVFNSIF